MASQKRTKAKSFSYIAHNRKVKKANHGSRPARGRRKRLGK